MERLDIITLVKSCNGEISGNFNESCHIDSITLDSRKVIQNCLFVAIKGDNHDGHDYVAKVVEDKSNFALVSNDFISDLPNLIRVPNTTIALGAISSFYRNQFKIPVVAITGSNGKTTVKEMLKSVCSYEYGDEYVLATSGNLNNHWGMPQTLLQLSSTHKVAIIEMGINHAGELDYLTKLAKPTVAVVNNVMFAHAGHFNGLADIANAKGEIYHGLVDGIACVDMSNQFALSWLSNDIDTKNIYKYGTLETECYIKSLGINSALYHTSLGDLEVKLKLLGQHNYKNALTVIALALNLGCSLQSIKLGLESYSGYKGRLESKTAFNGALIIDDTYNANPDSVHAAISAIQNLPKPHWFIFGDLKELGDNEISYHKDIGEFADQNLIDKLITVGNLSKYAYENFQGEKIHFSTNEDVVKYCTSHLPKHATLLVKGSNSMKLFDIVNELVAKIL